MLPGLVTDSQWAQLDEARRRHELRYREPETGLEVRCVAVEYLDFPTVEWTLYFKNTGEADTPIIADIQALDVRFQRLSDELYTRFARPGEFVLHHHTGSICAPNDYEPHAAVLRPNETKQIASSGGRGSNGEFPYFNIEWPGEGVIAVVGWPGQWLASFSRDEGGGLHVTAGQERTHFTLHPGEEVRTPLIVLQFWKGERVDAAKHGGVEIAHNCASCGIHLSTVAGCSFISLGNGYAREAPDRVHRDGGTIRGILWMDAGWYFNTSGWRIRGTGVDRTGSARAALIRTRAQQGIKTMCVVRARACNPGPGSSTTEWLLGADGGTKLLDLGNPDAWQWLVEHVDALLTEQGIDLYRQDFNMDPLDYWRGADGPERQGITEIRHVTGYLAFWDELLRRRPGLRIDTCASGGRRNDLETLRRSVPLWRTDYILEPIGTQCCTYGISSWIPFHGTGVKEADAYRFRSMMTPYPNCLWDARRTDLDYDEFRRLTSQWKQIAPNYAGDFYPLTPYSLANDIWIGWQFRPARIGRRNGAGFPREGSIYKRPSWVLARARLVPPDTDKPISMSGAALRDDRCGIARYGGADRDRGVSRLGAYYLYAD